MLPNKFSACCPSRIQVFQYFPFVLFINSNYGYLASLLYSSSNFFRFLRLSECKKVVSVFAQITLMSKVGIPFYATSRLTTKAPSLIANGLLTICSCQQYFRLLQVDYAVGRQLIPKPQHHSTKDHVYYTCLKRKSAHDNFLACKSILLLYPW